MGDCNDINKDPQAIYAAKHRMASRNETIQILASLDALLIELIRQEQDDKDNHHEHEKQPT